MCYGRLHFEEMEDELNEVLTPEEVMEFLCIGRNTCYKLLADGKLKGFRIGKLWRITREALRDYCDN